MEADGSVGRQLVSAAPLVGVSQAAGVVPQPSVDAVGPASQAVVAPQPRGVVVGPASRVVVGAGRAPLRDAGAGAAAAA